MTQPDIVSPLNELMDELPVPLYRTDAKGTIEYFNQSAAKLWGRSPVVGQDRWCGTHRIYKTDGTSLPHENCPMGVAIKENRSVRGETAIGERPDGTRFSFTPFPTPIQNVSGELVGGLNLLHDTTNQTDSQKFETVKKDLDLQVKALSKLHELSGFLNECNDSNSGFKETLNTLVELHGAQFGIISLYDRETGKLSPVVSVGFTNDVAKEFCAGPELNKGAIGTAFLSKKRVIIEDTEADLRYIDFRDLAKQAGFRAVHSTPVVCKDGSALGVISVKFSETYRPNSRELKVADMCARYVHQVASAGYAKKENHGAGIAT